MPVRCYFDFETQLQEALKGNLNREEYEEDYHFEKNRK